MLSRWRKDAQKKKDRVRKRKGKQRKKKRPHGASHEKTTKASQFAVWWKLQNKTIQLQKRMPWESISHKAIGKVHSITTDNGCEFIDPEKIKTVIGCNVYCTRAYKDNEEWRMINVYDSKMTRTGCPGGLGNDFSQSDLRRIRDGT